ncbi:MAG: folate-binding protein [Alphaproteobacteria bacterium]|nr:folate-binding protein [Alphaproteobacteria bacterium]
MNDAHYTALTDRGILSVSGADSLAFLQGIVTNDIEQVSPDCAIYAALLTPQGKYLHDFFVAKYRDGFLIDCSVNQLEELTKRLKMYRLRAQVEIEDQTNNFTIISVTDANTLRIMGLTAMPGNAVYYAEGIAFVDPRLAELGVRTILPLASAQEFTNTCDLSIQPLEIYKALQHSLGVPDGSDGEMLKQTFPLEIGFEELNAVSFDKGCYVGQEVTTRMKTRKLVKKRLIPVKFEGTSPEPGCAVLSKGKTAGQVFAVGEGNGLAMLRIEALAAETELVAEETLLQATQPNWFQLPG